MSEARGDGQFVVKERSLVIGGVPMTPQLVGGLIIILLGTLFTLDNLEILEARRYLRYWSVGLIAIGAAKMLFERSWSGAISGGVIAFIGTWILLRRLQIVRASLWELWPLLLILLGVSMVLNGMSKRTFALGAADSGDVVNSVAIMAASNRRSLSQEFRGGDLTAVMGGCELDLTKASIAGDEAVIDTFALWGGIEIRVPEDWIVVGRVFPLMGGFEDKTRPAQDAKKRLVIRGFVLMGGVEVKH